MMMTNGVGAVLGSVIAGWVIEHYFTKAYNTISDLAIHLNTTVSNEHLVSFLAKANTTVGSDGVLSRTIVMKDWPEIWLAFAGYALIIAIAFAILFKHKHDPEAVEENLSH